MWYLYYHRLYITHAATCSDTALKYDTMCRGCLILAIVYHDNVTLFILTIDNRDGVVVKKWFKSLFNYIKYGIINVSKDAS